MAIITARDGDYNLAEHYVREAKAVAGAVGRMTGTESHALVLAEATQLRGDLSSGCSTGRVRKAARSGARMRWPRPGTGEP